MKCYIIKLRMHAGPVRKNSTKAFHFLAQKACKHVSFLALCEAPPPLCTFLSSSHKLLLVPRHGVLGSSRSHRQHATGFTTPGNPARIRMRDLLTFTPFTSFDSRTQEKQAGPPRLLSQRAGFPPPPSSFPWSLVSTHAWLWHQSAGSVGRFKLRMSPPHHRGA